MNIQKIKTLNETLIKLLEDDNTTYNWVTNLDSKNTWDNTKGKGGFKTIEEAKQDLLDYIQREYEDCDIMYRGEEEVYNSVDPVFTDTGENGILAISFKWKDYKWEDTEFFYIVPESYVTKEEKYWDNVREFDSRYRKLQYSTNKKIYDLFEPFDFLSLTSHSGGGPIIEMRRRDSGAGALVCLWFSTQGRREISFSNDYSVPTYVDYDHGTNKNIINLLENLTSLYYKSEIHKKNTEEGYNEVVKEYDKLYEVAVEARDLIKKYEKDLSEYADENNILRGEDRIINTD